MPNYVDEFMNVGIGIVFIIFFILIIIGLICIVLELIGKWKVLKKAGKNGWEAIVPYYNNWVLIEVAGLKKWYFFVLLLISFINISLSFYDTNILGLDLILDAASVFVLFNINYNISKKFKKDLGFAVGLTILPFIFYMILGSNENVFDNNVDVSPYGILKGGE